MAYIRKSLGLFCAMLMVISASACDICGCGVSNYNPFLFPHLSKNFAGLTYLHRSFKITDEDGLTSNEKYNTYLFTLQHSITKNIQVVVLLPYQVNNLSSFGTDKRINGLGDASILLNYKVWDKLSVGKRQTLTVGGGVKIPTGEYVAENGNELSGHNFQLGSGSADYLVNAAYILNYRKWMFGTNTSYKYNTNNKDNFCFGDIFSVSTLIACRKDWDNISISPYLQLRDELQMINADKHILQQHTCGNVLYATPGVDITTKIVTVGAAVQLAPLQNMAEGQVKVNPAFSTHISIAF